MFANNTVYAGGCTTIGAFDAGHGALRWSVTTTGQVYGLSLAGGVLYACFDPAIGYGQAAAYDATSGTRLWTGPFCTAAPEVVNGTVYVTGNGKLTAFNLPGAGASRVTSSPDPHALHPNFQLPPQKFQILSEDATD